MISELSSEATACKIDLPGFGESPPLAPGNMTIRHYSLLTTQIITQVRQILRERGSSLKAIVADSLGAIFMLEAMRHQGDSAARMTDTVKVSLTGGIESASMKYDNRMLSQESRIKNVECLLLSGCPSDGLPSYISVAKKVKLIERSLSVLKSAPDWFSRELVRILSLGTVHRLGDINDDLLDSVLNADPMSSQMIFKDMVEYSFAGDVSEASGGVSETIVLRGEWDRVISESDSRHLAKKIDGTYLEIPGVGHTPMIEAPAKYASIISRQID